MALSTNVSPETIKDLAISNIKYNILTISFYRFWARSNVREFLWANTRINKEPLEYLGSGDELFKGFWIALIAIFAPLWALNQYTIIALKFQQAIIIGLGIYAIGFFIIGVGIWRARAYLLSRTYWRGIGFSLDSGAIQFGFSFLGHGILFLITLGWWLPMMRLKVAKRFWQATSWGDLRFGFNSNRSLHESVYGYFAIGWFATIAFSIVIVGTLGTMFSAILGTISHSPFLATLVGYAFLGVNWFISTLCYTSYRAAITRKIVSSIEIDGVSMESSLKGRDYLQVVLKNTIWNTITIGLATPFSSARHWSLIANSMIVEIDDEILSKVEAKISLTDGNAEGISDAFELPFFDMSPV